MEEPSKKKPFYLKIFNTDLFSSAGTISIAPRIANKLAGG